MARSSTRATRLRTVSPASARQRTGGACCPPRVIACLPDPGAATRLELALRGSATVERCTAAELVARSVSSHPAAAIVALRDAAGRTLVPLLGTLSRRIPGLALLAHCAHGRVDVDELVAAGRAGASAVIVDGVTDAAAALAPQLTLADRTRMAAAVRRAAGARLPGMVGRIVDHCLARADEALRVAHVAAAFSVSRRTLTSWTTRAGLPCPSALITWCRLLVAADRLASGGSSVERVALELDFASASAMRNLLRRYTGLRPADVRAGGGAQCVIDALVGVLGRGSLATGVARSPTEPDHARFPTCNPAAPDVSVAASP